MFRSHFHISCRQASNPNDLHIASPECLHTHCMRPQWHHFLQIKPPQTPWRVGRRRSGEAPKRIEYWTSLRVLSGWTALFCRNAVFWIPVTRSESNVTDNFGGGDPTGCLRHCWQAGLLSEIRMRTLTATTSSYIYFIHHLNLKRYISVAAVLYLLKHG